MKTYELLVPGSDRHNKVVEMVRAITNSLKDCCKDLSDKEFTELFVTTLITTLCTTCSVIGIEKKDLMDDVGSVFDHTVRARDTSKRAAA